MRLLGRPPSQARGMKSLPRNSLSIGMIIFVSVIGVMMLAHLASLIAVSSGRDCNNLLFHIRGNESSLGPMQVVFLCCVAGLGVVAAHAFSGVWLRTWDLQSALMGTLTLILLVLSMAYCAVYLAFAFPRTRFRNGSTHGPRYFKWNQLHSSPLNGPTPSPIILTGAVCRQEVVGMTHWG